MKKTTQPAGLIYKFKKLEKRVARSLQNGEFTQLQARKQSQLFRRLQNYATRLRQSVKPAILTALLALGLGTAAQAQIFAVETTGHPLAAISETAPLPSFVDIDNDGDMDCFMGVYDGTIVYYKNTGTATNPTFSATATTPNPFNGEDVGFSAAPFFVDIDNDGDMDAFIGEFDGIINYYENTGTNTAPTFTARTGAQNPLDGEDVGMDSSPVFVDIDNDGDMDCFSPNRGGQVKFFENTGTAAAATFVERTGTANPFDQVALGAGSYCHMDFADFNNDGDFDMVLTDVDGSARKLRYYNNAGTAANPSFSGFVVTNNPFDDNSFNNALSNLRVVDIDGDGDMDIYGEASNNLNLIRNTTPVNTAVYELVAEQLAVFPNPTKGQLNFDSPQTGTVSLYSQLGQLVYSQVIQQEQQLNLDLPAGVYQMLLEKDKKVYTTKVVIK